MLILVKGIKVVGFTIEEFYRTVVAPFVREFEKDRSDIRRAYAAVWALDSYASHIYYFYQEIRGLQKNSDIEFKKKVLGPKSQDFKLIMDVSAAIKHAVRSNPDKSKMSVYSSSDLISMKLDGFAAYVAGPDADEWGEQVIVHNDQHLFAPLLPKVLRAEKFLVEQEVALAKGADPAWDAPL